jgi:uncharacterized protein
VKGYLHEPAAAPRAAMTLFHGAGSNCESELMTAVAGAFCDAGFLVFRGDLPFRQLKRAPRGDSPLDRDGIRLAADELKKLAPKASLCLAGHSYGGRQSSMLAAQQKDLARALLLLSYPLHPPREPSKSRTGHLPMIACPVLFVHGTRDPFGTIAELEDATRLIPAVTVLFQVEKAAHSLPPAVAASLPEKLSAIMKW